MGLRETEGVVAAKLRMPPVGGLPRERLERLLAPLSQHRLGLVVAPAGAGKSTLLAHVTAGADAPVAWYRAEASDAEVASFLACIERAVCGVLPDAPDGWHSVEEAADALEQVSATRLLLVVDDLHTLLDTPAEQAFERLLHYAPPAMTVLAASRCAPGFNLPRMRVAGQVLEIGADDLRFRSWETERLFRDVYREPLSPEELAELTRRTEGWAAGLQLFHLATKGRRTDERRRILAGLNTPARFVREYLAGNVVDHLPQELRGFLLDTCVLGRLCGPVADAFLGRTGSGEVLQELERRQIFTSVIDADGWYRYHEVLRAHLQAVLVEKVGEEEARGRHRRAGALLEEWGAPHDALVAYCRGEDWAAAARLVGHEGEQLALDPGTWLDLLPVAFVDQDPWILLATARRLRAAGRWPQAVTAYRRAETTFADRRARDLCRRERLTLAAWLEPVLVHSADWTGLLRAATTRDPLLAAARAGELHGSAGRLSAGLCLLLAGHLGQAEQQLHAVAQAEGASAVLVVGARIGAAAAALLAGREAVGIVEEAAEEADRLGATWLAGLARTLLALTQRPDGRSEAASFRLAAERARDPWGRNLAVLVDGLAGARAGGAGGEALEQAAAAFKDLGAGVLQAWCLAARALALAVSGDPGAVAAARSADTLARALGVPGARALCDMARQRAVHEEAATATLPAESPATLRLFGSFLLKVRGAPTNLSGARPRARSVLKLLALQAGRSVHREVILGWLWPEADLHGGARQLHVAVSSLRRFLPEPVRILRDGEAYRLALPEGAIVDTETLENAVARARRAMAAGDVASAASALARVVDVHNGELLPEEGPAEWVIGQREHYRTLAVQAAEDLAGLHLRQGAALDAVQACERGLRIDRYRDGLWRTLIAAYTTARDPAAAARAQRRYDEVLEGLGLAPAGEQDLYPVSPFIVASGTRSR